jgi:hypothetical protein
MEHTEAPPAARLLPARHEWPYGRRAAEQRDEIASDARYICDETGDLAQC